MYCKKKEYIVQLHLCPESRNLDALQSQEFPTNIRFNKGICHNTTIAF